MKRVSKPKFNIVCPDPSIRMTDYQIEQFLLFSVAVAGKTANTIAKQLAEFLAMEKGTTPFQRIRKMIAKRLLMRNLKSAHLGKYKMLAKSYEQIVSMKLDLRTCTIDELESIHGIGNKTSRFFVMYAQGRTDVAVLDTHILKFMAKLQPQLQWDKAFIPKSTPTGQRYKEIEQAYLIICRLCNINPQELDTAIWMEYSGNEHSDRLERITSKFTRS